MSTPSEYHHSSAREPVIVDNILALIGRTPLVRLRNVTLGGATVWGKCEHLNPGGSIKDRICLAMIEAAERSGDLSPGMTVVEPTSGNTGIGLALVCRIKGYPVVLTMPESMSLERRSLLEAYGVEIVLTPANRVMEGALEKAREIVIERGAFMPQQFENSANPDVHARTTAEEIATDMSGETLAAFVAAVGTGGTISGVGKVLKKRDPNTRICAVEPASSPVLSGGAPGPSKIQGLNAGFVPLNYHPEFVDSVLHVGDLEAWKMQRRLAKEEGLLVGISAGANVVAATKLAAELPEDSHVVTILCDTGERYFSLDEYFDADDQGDG